MWACRRKFCIPLALSYQHFRRSVGILLGLASSVLGVQACGGDSTTSTSTTGETGGAPSTTSTATTTTSSAGGTGGGGGASTTVGVGGTGGATSSASSSGSASSSESATSSASSSGSASSSSSSASTSSTSSSSNASTGTGSRADCTETTLEAFKNYLLGDNSYAIYTSIASPNLGDPSSYDKLFFELYGSSVAAGLDGELKGTFDLSAGSDTNYATCSRCLFLIDDFSGMNTYFFQQSGTMVIDATSDQLNGTIHGTLTDVTLVEVTIDSMGFTTPVPGGACRHVATAAVTVVPAVAPAAWVCNPLDYGDGVCQCGCGAVDIDCDDATLASCEHCDEIDSCSVDACPGTINPANNAVCTP